MSTSNNLQNFYMTKQAGLAEYIKKLLMGGALGAGVGGAYGAGQGYFGEETSTAIEAAEKRYAESQAAVAEMQKAIDSRHKSKYDENMALYGVAKEEHLAQEDTAQQNREEEYHTASQKYQKQIDEFKAQAHDTYKAELAIANEQLSSGEASRTREISHRERQLKSETRNQSREMVASLKKLRDTEMPEYRIRLAEEMNKLDMSNPKDQAKHVRLMDKLNETWEWERDWYEHTPQGSRGTLSFQDQFQKNLEPWRDRLEDTTAKHDDTVAQLLSARDALAPEQHDLGEGPVLGEGSILGAGPIKPLLDSTDLPSIPTPDYNQMKLDAARNKGLQGMGLGALIGGGAGLGYQALNDLLFSGGPEPKYASTKLQHRTGSLMGMLGAPVGAANLTGNLGKLASSYLQGSLYGTPEQD